MKLNLGCGDIRLPGFVNVDFRKTLATDVVCDIRELDKYFESADVIECYHTIEHLPHYNIVDVLKGWRKVLKGRMVIECPDFEKGCEKYLASKNRKELIPWFFGKQNHDGNYHYSGWDFHTLKDVLEQAGFKDIQQKPAKDHHAKQFPCLRIECS